MDKPAWFTRVTILVTFYWKKGLLDLSKTNIQVGHWLNSESVGTKRCVISKQISHFGNSGRGVAKPWESLQYLFARGAGIFLKW